MAKSATLQHLSNGRKDTGMGESYTPTFEPTKEVSRNIILKLVNPQEGNVYCPVYAENVTNPKTNNLDTVRLLKGVYSIWKSEQKEVSEDYAKKNRRSFVFHSYLDGNGNTQSQCTLQETDKTAIEASKYLPANMDSNAPNRGSKFSFYEYNPAKQAEEQMAKDVILVEAMQKAFTIPEQDMRKHALYLGVSFVDELGQVKAPDTIRTHYAVRAKQNPKLFLDTMNSPIVNVSYMVRKAISDAKIDLGRTPNTAHWSNGGFICAIPSSKKAIEYLLEFAMMPTDEGKSFKEQLEKTMV